MSLIIVKQLFSALWFFTYHFTLLPLMVTVPVLLIIGIAVPGIMQKAVEKQSIVERIRADG